MGKGWQKNQKKKKKYHTDNLILIKRPIEKKT